MPAGQDEDRGKDLSYVRCGVPLAAGRKGLPARCRAARGAPREAARCHGVYGIAVYADTFESPEGSTCRFPIHELGKIWIFLLQIDERSHILEAMAAMEHADETNHHPLQGGPSAPEPPRFIGFSRARML